jgi:pSer/pThr/pTyr-binding forkhead associated (FHA) protein
MSVKLLVVQGKPSGKNLVFKRGDYYFGRGPECHVRPQSEWVSRQHCVLRVTADGVFIRDLGSRNGTLVNGVLVERELRLSDGDQVQIGPLVFEVRLPVLDEAVRATLDPHNEATAELDVHTTDIGSTPGPEVATTSTQSYPILPPP